jgi:hypothetical protein
MSVAATGITAVVLRFALLPIFPVPEPIVHDEFGYLLAADTFAHGKLTNPTHPMWVHFESFSILQKPTYQCIAQPAQGMILAFGKVLLGHPFWGVLLSIGLMCAALTWMLQGWVAPEWAMLGGVFAILRYAALSNWGNSYWGGALGAMGGALVLGALPRLKTEPKARTALLAAFGLVLLANNRPYEGFVLSLPVSGLLLASMLGKHGPPFRILMKAVILPMAAFLALAGLGTTYYFRQVTGSPFRMPYQIERETYGIAPYFVWQRSRPTPVYGNAVMQKMYTQQEITGADVFRSFTGTLLKLYLFWSFYLGPALTLPFLMFGFCLPVGFRWRDISERTRTLIFISACFTLGLTLENFYNARYSAPATGLVLALVLLGMKTLRNWNASGLFLSRAVPLICVLSFGLRASAGMLHIPLRTYYEFAWHQKGEMSFGRAIVEQRLKSLPGNHLVLVHYGPQHDPFAEWVYNEADIDDSKVVWAREISPEEDQKLLEYFHARTIWVLDADDDPPNLKQLTR